MTVWHTMIPRFILEAKKQDKDFSNYFDFYNALALYTDPLCGKMKDGAHIANGGTADIYSRVLPTDSFLVAYTRDQFVKKQPGRHLLFHILAILYDR